MNVMNQIWDFFASVRLAIFTLIVLAVTSIVGTIIPQNEPVQFYVQNFGPKTAQFLQILDLHKMYYSWWFLGLLGLLSANLAVCSIERFPGVWKIIHTDNYTSGKDRLLKMSHSANWKLKDLPGFSLEQILESFQKQGWRLAAKMTGDGNLYFAQKNRWSRSGVYIVHTSILVIFAGAIIGHFTGFKGSIMLPELQSSSVAYAYGSSQPLQLGFDVRCDFFTIEFYPNGMPKEYTSKLTITDNGVEMLSKQIEVNHPLTYRGITFYQSSYQGYQNFIFEFTNQENGRVTRFPIPFQKQDTWEEKNIKFGIVNAEAMGQLVTRVKVWLKVADNPATIQWLKEDQPLEFAAGSENFKVTTKQMYATGLQVAKDPGVWVVYLGCGLMLIGLYMAFFLSHKRLWLLVPEPDKENSAQIILAGVASKNKPGFSKEFLELKEIVKKE